MKLQVPYNFEPREYQLPVAEAFDSGIKHFVCVWHRRAGKDKLWLNLTIKAMLQRVGSYYHVFPTYTQGKKILWEGIGADGLSYLSHFPVQLIESKNEASMSIKLRNGSRWQVVGSDTCDGDALVGTNPVGVVFSEFALQNPLVREKLRPILRENGGWDAYVYTPRGHNHGWELYEMAKQDLSWHTSLLTIRQTARGASEKYKPGEPIMTQSDVEEEVRQGMDEDLAMQEFYCSFEGPQQGSYYGKIIQELKNNGQVTGIACDPRLPVYTFWDLGVDDYTTIWFMQDIRGREYRFIDYYEANGHGVEHYIKKLREYPYTYAAHYLPHDIAAREFGSGTSPKEVMDGLGFRDVEVVPASSVQDGIDAVRRLLPLCWFDAVKTKDGLNALVSYKREYDEKRKQFKTSPLHDWSSHAADAFRQFVTGYKEHVKSKPRNLESAYRESGSWMR